MTKYIVYEDPGHAWMKVTIKELFKLGIADKISGYSYMRGDYAYLEEDADLTLFMNTKERRGDKVEFDVRATDKLSRIRNYQRYEMPKGSRYIGNSSKPRKYYYRLKAYDRNDVTANAVEYTFNTKEELARMVGVPVSDIENETKGYFKDALMEYEWAKVNLRRRRK